MKLIIFILTLIIAFNLNAISQEFAPIGSTWIVELREPFAPSWFGTLYNESRRDTIFGGMNCKIMFKSQGTTCNTIGGEYILCQKGDSVLHYIEALDSFNVVMDFGAEIGESWESFDQANNHISFGTEINYKYIVDSIKYYKSDNVDSIRIQHLSQYIKTWDEEDNLYRSKTKRELIQHLGFRSALLPTNGGDGYTDGISETNIISYESPEIGFIKLENLKDITSSLIEEEEFEINIYPNPFTDILNIETIDGTIEKILVYNQLGKLIHYKDYNPKLDLTDFRNGIYIIQLLNRTSVYTSKIIKTNR